MENSMRFDVKTGSVTRQRTDCLILPIYSEGPLPQATRAIDAATGGLISELIDAGDISGKTGTTLLFKPSDGVACKRVMLVGCGTRGAFGRKNFRKALSSAYAALRKTGHETAISYLNMEPIKGADVYRRARISAETWHSGSYRFTAMKTETHESPGVQKSLGLAALPAQKAKIRKGIHHGDAIGRGMSVSREVANLPANICTPSFLVEEARRIAKNNKNLRVEVLEEKDMQKLGMGALLSVTAGTDEPAKFIILKYLAGARSKKPTVLVGKGVTFDSGGISLKPGAAMDEMKFDMCGAATVLGVFSAIAALSPSMNLIGLIPACENLPSGNATKPGDIVTSMSGQTIEVLNTDAEGRLILCDALTYAQKFDPATVIDIATLTGACVIALGKHVSGLLSNSDALARALLKSGDNADDPAWQLPLREEYMAQLKSNFADVANIGGRDAGTITAACFLSRFVGDMNWAHLDIAGTAWRSGGQKGSTGRPVPLLTEYLLSKH
jgi:leucyl aminopeptidase